MRGKVSNVWHDFVCSKDIRTRKLLTFKILQYDWYKNALYAFWLCIVDWFPFTCHVINHGNKFFCYFVHECSQKKFRRLWRVHLVWNVIDFVHEWQSTMYWNLALDKKWSQLRGYDQLIIGKFLKILLNAVVNNFKLTLRFVDKKSYPRANGIIHWFWRVI